MEEEPVAVLLKQPKSLTLKNVRKIRCPKGTVRDKKTKRCVPKPSSPPVPLANPEDVPVPESPVPLSAPEDVPLVPVAPKETAPPIHHLTLRVKKARCPPGTRRNRKTGDCEPIPLPVVAKNNAHDEAEKVPVPETTNKADSPPLETAVIVSETAAREPPVLEFEVANAGTAHNDATNFDPKTLLYPTLEEFSADSMAQRPEFQNTYYSGPDAEVERKAEEMCHAEFELSPHQLFVRNFMSPDTPYNNLLMYFGLGSGKTCAAIGIAEEMRKFMKRTHLQNKPILIIASPVVQVNFKQQLVDSTKLVFNDEDGHWHLNTCVGESLLLEVGAHVLGKDQRQQVVQRLNSVIDQYYEFKGYIELGNYISKNTEVKGKTGGKNSKLRAKKIEKLFNDRLVIIDEVHNIIPNRWSAQQQQQQQLPLMDASPQQKNQEQVGTLLMQVAEYAQSMRLVLLSATPTFNDPRDILWITKLFLANDKRVAMDESLVFDKHGDFIEPGGREILAKKLNGYVAHVRGENPYTFPVRLYPSTFQPTRNILEWSKPTKDYLGHEIRTDHQLQHIQAYCCPMGNEQATIYRRVLETMSVQEEDHLGLKDLNLLLQSTIVSFPSKNADPRDCVGTTGLQQIIRFTHSDGRLGAIYQPDVPAIFDQDQLSHFSGKIHDICECIQKSHGIVMIYSRFIDGGLVPMALALEKRGFSRFRKNESCKSQSMWRDGEKNTNLQYIMICGSNVYSPEKESDIQAACHDLNANGDRIRVILISESAAEGLDFKNVRQIHIMDPWYNMNRMEQIIGRGVRNGSHCALPFRRRNTEIYLHCAVFPEEQAAEETVDGYLYRLAERKAKRIGQVTRLLKETSVDAVLNRAQYRYTVKGFNQTVELELPSNSGPNAGVISYEIGDRDYTDICDYQTCPDEPMPMNTTDENATTQVGTVVLDTRLMKKIIHLFEEQAALKRSQIISVINNQSGKKQYSYEQIFYALETIISQRKSFPDVHGNMGHIIYRGSYYLFQPDDVDDTSMAQEQRHEHVNNMPESVPLSENEIMPLPPPPPLPLPLPLQGHITASTTVFANVADPWKRLEAMIKIVNEGGTKILRGTPELWYMTLHSIIHDEKGLVAEYKSLVDVVSVHHFLETAVTMDEKLKMANECMTTKKDDDDDATTTIPSNLLSHVKEYFRNKITPDGLYMCLDDGQNMDFYLLNREKIWIPLDDELEQDIIDKFPGFAENLAWIADQRRRKIDMNVAFMEKTGDHVVFKLRHVDTGQKNVTGVNMLTMDKKNIMEKIRLVSVVGTDLAVSLKNNEKQELVVLLEFLLRVKMISGESNDSIRYLPPEFYHNYFSKKTK